MILICKGTNEQSSTKVWIAKVFKEVEKEVEGKIVSEEEVMLKRVFKSTRAPDMTIDIMTKWGPASLPTATQQNQDCWHRQF